LSETQNIKRQAIRQKQSNMNDKADLTNNNQSHVQNLTLGGLIVTLGIVYGDIGTSPLYVLRAIVAGLPELMEGFSLGALSCVFWTLTLQTTIKYVVITLRADNKGEGGIFSLYALLRKKKIKENGVEKKRMIPVMLAIIGASALIADGIITPSITVVSAVEGLKAFNSETQVLPIVFAIIAFLFLIQQFGTDFVGKSFGPIMFFWFLMLGVLGLINIMVYPAIIKAFSPHYAYRLLTAYPHGFLILGAVFLCTTGAEALYSDLGHCGLANIPSSWIYVKTCLILNYLGQGAWILMHVETITPEINPFFAMMPQKFLMIGIILSTMAAVIASQALISGSYTIFSEAILFNFWPKMRIKYPTNIKGQMYIPAVNWMLCVCCMFVIGYFQESAKMEAAYGLSITITMLMTTCLLSYYMRDNGISLPVVAFFFTVYLSIESSFLIANLFKFMHGGWLTVLLAGLIASVMYVWFEAREIKKKFTRFETIRKYYEIIEDMRNDTSIPKYSTNLVYLTRADRKTDVEYKIIYSLINKHPKRADIYWLVHVHILDDPHTSDYYVESLIPNLFFRIEFRIGFRVNPRINLFLRQVIQDMIKRNEVDITSRYESLKKHHVPGDFRFVLIDRIPNVDIDFSPFERLIMHVYGILKKISITEVKAFGLDTSNVTVEEVPMSVDIKFEKKLTRINPTEA